MCLAFAQRKIAIIAVVTIGNSVTVIGEGAFQNCSSLTSVYCKPTTPPVIGSNLFYGCDSSIIEIMVPANSVAAYKSASGWSDYSSYIVGYNF